MAEQAWEGACVQRGALECSNRTLVKGPEDDPPFAYESYALPSVQLETPWSYLSAGLDPQRTGYYGSEKAEG